MCTIETNKLLYYHFGKSFFQCRSKVRSMECVFVFIHVQTIFIDVMDSLHLLKLQYFIKELYFKNKSLLSFEIRTKIFRQVVW